MSVELLEEVDTFSQLRNGLRSLAEDRGDWAGIPMPLEGQPLVVESKWPNAKEFMEIGRKEESHTIWPEPKIRNRFWSHKLRSEILIWNEGEKLQWGVSPGLHHLSNDLHTMGASVAWGIEQESNALQTLAQLLPHHAFKKYLLTGMFLESSQRSNVTYMFRRLKPTVAIAPAGEQMRILCVLCMHPIGYYEGTWAGAMCPTDDVIAHLMLMRGNEHLFWRRANQHPPHKPEAGL